MALLWLVVGFARRRKLRVAWWGWVLTVIGFGYLTFIAMAILAFIREKQYQAVLPIGAIMGFPALILAVFLYRFAFNRTAKISAGK